MKLPRWLRCSCIPKPSRKSKNKKIQNDIGKENEERIRKENLQLELKKIEKVKEKEEKDKEEQIKEETLQLELEKKEKENQIEIKKKEKEKEKEEQIRKEAIKREIEKQEKEKEKEKEEQIRKEAIKIEIEKTQPPPLNNKADNCYMNSIMQALGSCVQFKEDLKVLNLEYDCTKLKLFIKLLEALNSSTAQCEFDEFMSQYGWDKDGQQDSYEMMAFMINSIYNELKDEEFKKHEGLNKRKFNSLWKEKSLPCRLKIYSRAICACESNSVGIINDLSLHLPLVNEEGICHKLTKMMEEIFKEEPIEGGCDECEKEKTLTLSIDEDVPRTLCLHIQANSYDPETGNIKKPKYELEYPFKLMFEGKKYQLVSFVEHFGGVSMGHYSAFRFFDKRWFIVNDQQVDALQHAEEPSKYSFKPYVLFYEAY